MKITSCDRGVASRFRWLKAMALAWLLAGIANSTWRIEFSDISSADSRCSHGSCLPLPAEMSASMPVLAWDVAGQACGQEPAEPKPQEKAPAPADESKQEKKNEWVDLFDGKSLEGWKETDFAGQGTVEIADEQIKLGFGQDLTGITWDSDDFPKTNYELELEAMRVDGADFFCGLTFPIEEQTCSLIVGGWGGTVVGLSSIDRFDASMNETTKFMTFKRGQWYKIRLRVTPGNVDAWIDDEQVVDFDVADHKISIRVEVQASKPLGIASWQTTAALRNIRLRRLEEGDGAMPPAEQATPRE